MSYSIEESNWEPGIGYVGNHSNLQGKNKRLHGSLPSRYIAWHFRHREALAARQASRRPSAISGGGGRNIRMGFRTLIALLQTLSRQVEMEKGSLG